MNSWHTDLPDPLEPLDPPGLSRREFLAAALLSPAAFRQAPRDDARYVGNVPLAAPGASPPFGRLLGEGLDARLFTDLSQLVDPQSTIPTSAINQQSAISNQQFSPVTPTDRFFVRTAASPSMLPATESWAIRVGGLVKTPAAMPLRDLEPHAAPALRALLECSGNADPLNYGLLSAADWEGVPVRAGRERV